MRWKRLWLGIAAAGGLSIAGLAGLSVPANAYIACDRDGGDCWHSDRRYHAPGMTFEYHPDDWYFHRHWDEDHEHHWRGEYHEGRGHWRNGVWITF
jgi:hypothetical protein